jgi:hypothetical protein
MASAYSWRGAFTANFRSSHRGKLIRILLFQNILLKFWFLFQVSFPIKLEKYTLPLIYKKDFVSQI